jgi:hypothetical protein
MGLMSIDTLGDTFSLRLTLGLGLTLGKGLDLMYPFRRVPTHPLRVLGDAALGKKCGEFALCRYYGCTSLWCFALKSFVK